MKSLLLTLIKHKKSTSEIFSIKAFHLTSSLVIALVLVFSISEVQAQISIGLSDRNGNNVARYRGDTSTNNIGNATASGDINGDGLDDFIIGAYRADVNFFASAGKIYIVFGTDEGIRASTDLSTLDGTNGFVVNGNNTSYQIGKTLSSGDVNGDGIDDVIIGAPFAESERGHVYVVYGKSSFSASVGVGSLSGTVGLTVKGIGGTNQAGSSVSSGDINNDGINDILIGASKADPNEVNSAGQTYVVYGSNGFSNTFFISDLDGTNGFTINGNANTIFSGGDLSSGDFNNDGIDDVLIGATGAKSAGLTKGGAFVLFGKSTAFATTIELSSLDGDNGFSIFGISGGDTFGSSVANGDVNGDGTDDLVIGAENLEIPWTKAGEAYVIFGKNSYASSIDLSSLDGTNGFKLTGITIQDRAGIDVTSGDVNGDNFDDVIVGAPEADAGDIDKAGATYVVFGKSSFASSISFASLNGTTGFAITGGAADDQVGFANSVGDFNGDGADEIFIGVENEDVGGSNFGGAAYVVFNTLAKKITGDEGFRMLSAPTNGTVFNELLDSVWTQGFTGADEASGTTNAWTWDQATQDWTALTNQNTNILPVGNGFLSYIFSDDDVNTAGDAGFPKMINASQYGGDGTLTTGTIAPVSDLADGEFFLMGNPYNGTIDWDRAAVTKTNLSNTVYIYDNANSTYQSWNGSVGNINLGRISAFQSFFIQADGGVGGISITEGAVINNGANNVTELLKITNVTEPKSLKISAESDDLISDAWFSFQEGGEVTKDKFDGLALQSLSSTYLQLATIIDNQELLQINALPIDQTEELSFPLHISGNIESNIAELSFEGLEAFDGWEISLFDSETEESFPIEEGSVLKIDITKVASKEFPQPKLPTPIAQKAKIVSTKYQVIIKPSTTTVNNEGTSNLPTEVSLDQNYPNPFNPSTTIAYGVPKTGKVTLEVFDILGRKVVTLLNQENRTAGRHTINFDARNLASGMYIYRLQAGNVVMTKKLTLIK